MKSIDNVIENQDWGGMLRFEAEFTAQFLSQLKQAEWEEGSISTFYVGKRPFEILENGEIVEWVWNPFMKSINSGPFFGAYQKFSFGFINE